MPQIASADLDLLDRFEVIVDPNAEPADLDEALASFLLNDVRRRQSSAETSPTDQIESDSEAKEW